MVQDFLVDTKAARGPFTLESYVPPHVEGAVTWQRDSILFSSCNEDSWAELKAFGDLRGKHVFCITAGGGRVLNLLAGRPESIWAIDLNPAQNFLLELKAAGMRELEHEAYLRFLGIREDSDRLGTYQRLRGHLTLGAQQFFDAYPQLIAEGVIFQGRLERYFRKLAKVLQWAHALGVRRVFECEDIAEQRRLVDKLDTPFFRLVGETACRRSVLRAFSGDPGFYRYVPDEVALHRVIYGGVIDHFRNYLARDNPLMQLIFFGRFFYEPALPAYLNAATYDRVREALANVRIVTFTGTANDAFRQAGPERFDALSMSDISSYLDDESHHTLFDDALRAARPGAIVCSRSNIHHRPLSPEQEARLTRDRALEQALAISDHSCVHKFLIGRVT